MKKLTIALALTTVGGAALAQNCAGPCATTANNVTLYGVADVAIGKVASTGGTKVGAIANTIINNGNSRIGVWGREDLGNGLWAGYRIEGNVSLADGSGGSWTRYAFIALGSPFGTLQLGRNMTPGYDGQMIYDLTHAVNYSIIGVTYGWSGNPDARANAQLEYVTPNFSGLSAEVAYTPKADGALVDDGIANTSDHWGANLVYNTGPIKAAVTMDKYGNTKTGGIADKLSWSVGGGYIIDNMFALSASYSRANNASHWQGTPGYIYGVRRFGFELGASFFTGPYTLTVDLTRDTKNELYGGKKYTNALLEGKYSLSKRTFLYADYMRLDGDNNYALGLRHNF